MKLLLGLVGLLMIISQATALDLVYVGTALGQWGKLDVTTLLDGTVNGKRLMADFLEFPSRARKSVTVTEKAAPQFCVAVSDQSNLTKIGLVTGDTWRVSQNLQGIIWTAFGRGGDWSKLFGWNSTKQKLISFDVVSGEWASHYELPEGAVAGGPLVWEKQGFLLGAVSYKGSVGIYRFELAQKTMTRLVESGWRCTLSLDGKWLAYVCPDKNEWDEPALWLANLDDGALNPRKLCLGDTPCFTGPNTMLYSVLSLVVAPEGEDEAECIYGLDFGGVKLRRSAGIASLGQGVQIDGIAVR